MKAFVNAWVGAGNLGDELIFSALRTSLTDLGIDEITVTSRDPRATARQFGVDAVQFGSLVAGERAVRSADVVLFGGGGLLQDGTSRASVAYQGWRPAVVRMHRKPFVGIGLGIGPLQHRSSRVAAKWLLERHELLTVRDQGSADLLQQCGVRDVTVTADLALTLPPRDSAGSRISVCLRAWRGEGGILPKANDTRPDPAMVSAAAAALDDLARELDARVRLVVFERRRDELLAEQLRTQMTTEPEVVMPGLDDVVDVIADSVLVIAMRYHAAVCAVLAARPLICIPYASKGRSLIEDLGDACASLEHSVGAWSHLHEAAAAALARAPAMRSARQRLRARAARNGELLADVVSSL